MKHELVIFDCDGVLVDTEPISNGIIAELLTDLGMPLTPEESMERFMGKSRAANTTTMEQALGRPLPAGFWPEYERLAFAAYAQRLNPVSGIAAALDALTIPICVASSGEHEKMRVTLGVTGLLPRFEGCVFSATEVGRGKPYPDLFLLAARRMGVPAGRCAVVEDSVPGVQAGVAAGMTVFGYAGSANADLLRQAGAHVFHDMAALPSLLSQDQA